MSDQGPEKETEVTAEPQIEVDPAREARGVESDFIARLAARVGARLPEDARALVEAGRADWHARIERGEVPPNDASTAEDWAALRARLAGERAADWRASVDQEYADAHPSKLSEDQHPDKLRHGRQRQDVRRARHRERGLRPGMGGRLDGG
jgi:hypothetical protein